MDVEGTIQFILESQARLTAHQQVVDERIDRLTDGMDRLTGIVERSVTLFAESKAETDRRINILDEALKSLAEAQKVTELKLQAFIDNLNKGRNGHA